MSPLFWLTVLLIGGASFCGDCAIEFFRIHYFKNGSDYVREFMHRKISEDEEGDVQVTEQDLQDINEFMKPIVEYHKKQDMEREEYLSNIRDMKRIKHQAQDLYGK